MPNAKHRKLWDQVSLSPHGEEEYVGKADDPGGAFVMNGAADPNDRN